MVAVSKSRFANDLRNGPVVGARRGTYHRTGRALPESGPAACGAGSSCPPGPSRSMRPQLTSRKSSDRDVPSPLATFDIALTDGFRNPVSMPAM